MSIYAKMNKKKKEEEEESSEDEIKENEEEEEEEEDISNSSVMDKYKSAADIANRALQKVVSETKPGVKIIDLCILGDKEIEENLKKVYTKKKDMEKGVSFPTCVSVNEVVGHFSPIPDDPSGELKEGDVVKIDLGVHIDGFIGMAATTVVASLSSAPITGRKADLIQAVNTAAECAHRLIKPGKTNSEVTAMIKKIAETYKVNPMEGVLSHQIKRYIVDGNRVIINKEAVDQKVEEFEFEQGEVYCVDILMSTGEGKAREIDSRTTVFKRALDQTYLLKLNAARAVLNEINKKFPTFPFTMRALEDKRARLGVSEMLKHDLLHTYPVLYEKAGEFVAQIKFTVMITSSATERTTISPLQQLQPDIKLEDKPIIDLLAQGTKRGAKKNKKKKPKKKEGEKTEEVKTEAKA